MGRSLRIPPPGLIDPGAIPRRPAGTSRELADTTTRLESAKFELRGPLDQSPSGVALPQRAAGPSPVLHRSLRGPGPAGACTAHAPPPGRVGGGVPGSKSTAAGKSRWGCGDGKDTGRGTTPKKKKKKKPPFWSAPAVAARRGRARRSVRAAPPKQARSGRLCFAALTTRQDPPAFWAAARRCSTPRGITRNSFPVCKASSLPPCQRYGPLRRLAAPGCPFSDLGQRRFARRRRFPSPPPSRAYNPRRGFESQQMRESVEEAALWAAPLHPLPIPSSAIYAVVRNKPCFAAPPSWLRPKSPDVRARTFCRRPLRGGPTLVGPASSNSARPAAPCQT